MHCFCSLTGNSLFPRLEEVERLSKAGDETTRKLIERHDKNVSELTGENEKLRSNNKSLEEKYNRWGPPWCTCFLATTLALDPGGTTLAYRSGFNILVIELGTGPKFVGCGHSNCRWRSTDRQTFSLSIVWRSICHVFEQYQILGKGTSVRVSTCTNCGWNRPGDFA